ncbi:hypothetical protein TorRG33x02_324890 [Trema orientale]|uniref:Uncharacterized protein n=1 Tax=Trema orientale TaxID=63057 RepID=A0A2P5BDP0_TREOI|nr:hypothetical protein TorRG33x02_324890 [Trema orientale]
MVINLYKNSTVSEEGKLIGVGKRTVSEDEGSGWASYISDKVSAVWTPEGHYIVGQVVDLCKSDLCRATIRLGLSNQAFQVISRFPRESKIADMAPSTKY